MIVPLLLSAILVFHNLSSVYSLSENEDCITPNNEVAKCIRLSWCTPITNALQSNVQQATPFAQQSQCGYSTEPLVCCGSSGFFTPTNVATPTNEVYQHRLLPTPDICGIESSNPKIHYGEETDLREFPWIALFGYAVEGETELTFACSGSLISKRYVLTAAHCVKTSRRTLTTVRLGEHNTNTNIDCKGLEQYQVCNPVAEDFAVENIITHNNYKNKKKIDDIALVRLNRNVNFKEHILPICLPAQSAPRRVGSTVTVAGWGQTEKGTSSSVKLKAQLAIISPTECKSKFSDLANITDRQYCATGLCIQQGKNCADSCNGDSGGPSIRSIKTDDLSKFQWIQEGITSFGLTICGQGYPAVYTKVSKYVQWIVDNMTD